MYVGSLVYHRKANGDEQRCDKVGDEGVCSHLLKVASEFLRDNGSCRSARTNDTCQHSFGKRQAVARKIKSHDYCHNRCNCQHLKHAYPQVPSHGAQLVSNTGSAARANPSSAGTSAKIR